MEVVADDMDAASPAKMSNVEASIPPPVASIVFLKFTFDPAIEAAVCAWMFCAVSKKAWAVDCEPKFIL